MIKSPDGEDLSDTMLASNIHDLFGNTTQDGYRIRGTVTVTEDDSRCNLITASVASISNNEITDSGTNHLDIGFDYTSRMPVISIVVNANNNRYPTQNKITARYNVDIGAYTGKRDNIKMSLLYGLTVDQNGTLKKGYGIDVIKSQLEILLKTKKGDRLMMPEYGTNLAAIVFSQRKDSDLLSGINSEISTALSSYFSGVRLDSSSIVRSGKKAEITANFKIASSSFSISLDYHA
jgi:phage baseplate assembly protein W